MFRCQAFVEAQAHGKGAEVEDAAQDVLDEAAAVAQETFGRGDVFAGVGVEMKDIGVAGDEVCGDGRCQHQPFECAAARQGHIDLTV